MDNELVKRFYQIIIFLDVNYKNYFYDFFQIFY